MSIIFLSVLGLCHQIPVRQASIAASSPASTLAACKKVIETLALVRLGVRWTLWEERSVGTSIGAAAKKVLAIPEVSAILSMRPRMLR